jgi:hypothetical protein
VPGKDRCGAEQLFQQHGARQQVRPGGAAKGQQQVCAGAFFGRMAIGCAQHKPTFTHTPVAPFLQATGQFLGREIAALFVQQDSAARGGRIGNAPASFGQFGQLQRPDNALFIARNQLRLGRTGDLSASDDV